MIEHETASAPALPTQFHTLRDCRNLRNLNIILLVGVVATGVATGLYFAAKHTTKGSLADASASEKIAVDASAINAKDTSLSRACHWWTDTQAREEAKVTVKR